jgi:hypothetical protein
MPSEDWFMGDGRLQLRRQRVLDRSKDTSAPTTASQEGR